MSNVFRVKFLEGLKEIHHKLKFPDILNFLADPNTFSQWLYHEILLEWVVFSKRLSFFTDKRLLKITRDGSALKI